MNKDLARVIAAIEIDRVFGKLPQEQHLKELLALENDGEDVRSALRNDSDTTTLERYIVYLAKKGNDFAPVQEAIRSRASMAAHVEALPEQQVAQGRNFKRVCQNPVVKKILASDQTFFSSLDHSLVETAKRYHAANRDMHGCSGYDHVDSPVGRIRDAIRKWVTVDFLTSQRGESAVPMVPFVMKMLA